LHQIQYAVKQGCARLRKALKCTLEAIFTVMESRIADRKAAKTTIMAFVAGGVWCFVQPNLRAIGIILLGKTQVITPALPCC